MHCRQAWQLTGWQQWGRQADCQSGVTETGGRLSRHINNQLTVCINADSSSRPARSTPGGRCDHCPLCRPASPSAAAPKALVAQPLGGRPFGASDDGAAAVQGVLVDSAVDRGRKEEQRIALAGLDLQRAAAGGGRQAARRVSRGGCRWRTWAGGWWMESRPAGRQLCSLAGALSSLVPWPVAYHPRLSREVLTKRKAATNTPPPTALPTQATPTIQPRGKAALTHPDACVTRLVVNVGQPAQPLPALQQEHRLPALLGIRQVDQHGGHLHVGQERECACVCVRECVRVM